MGARLSTKSSLVFLKPLLSKSVWAGTLFFMTSRIVLFAPICLAASKKAFIIAAPAPLLRLAGVTPSLVIQVELPTLA